MRIDRDGPNYDSFDGLSEPSGGILPALLARRHTADIAILGECYVLTRILAAPVEASQAGLVIAGLIFGLGALALLRDHAENRKTKPDLPPQPRDDPEGSSKA